MIVDEEVYLEHYGVKGMRWGVIRQKARTNNARGARQAAAIYKKMADENPNFINNKAAKKSQAKADRLTRLAEGKETKSDKRIRYASNGAKLAAGAIVVGIILQERGRKPLKTPPKSYKTVAERLIREEQSTQMSSLTRMFKEGKMDATQFKNFSEKLNARYDRRVAEALLNS